MPWSRHTDEATGREYWYNDKLFESRWTPPSDDEEEEEEDEEEAAVALHLAQYNIHRVTPKRRRPHARTTQSTSVAMYPHSGDVAEPLGHFWQEEAAEEAEETDDDDEAGVPLAVMRAAGPLPPPLKVPPPVLSGRPRPRGVQGRARRVKPQPRGGRHVPRNPVPPPFGNELTSSEQEVAAFYENLLYQTLVHNGLLQELALGALTQNAMARAGLGLEDEPLAPRFGRPSRELPPPSIEQLAASDYPIVPVTTKQEAAAPRDSPPPRAVEPLGMRRSSSAVLERRHRAATASDSSSPVLQPLRRGSFSHPDPHPALGCRF